MLAYNMRLKRFIALRCQLPIDSLSVVCNSQFSLSEDSCEVVLSALILNDLDRIIQGHRV